MGSSFVRRGRAAERGDAAEGAVRLRSPAKRLVAASRGRRARFNGGPSTVDFGRRAYRSRLRTRVESTSCTVRERFLFSSTKSKCRGGDDAHDRRRSAAQGPLRRPAKQIDRTTTIFATRPAIASMNTVTHDTALHDDDALSILGSATFRSGDASVGSEVFGLRWPLPPTTRSVGIRALLSPIASKSSYFHGQSSLRRQSLLPLQHRLPP